MEEEALAERIPDYPVVVTPAAQAVGGAIPAPAAVRAAGRPPGRVAFRGTSVLEQKLISAAAVPPVTTLRTRRCQL